MWWWQWHQLDHVSITFTLLQTDNHVIISSVNVYRLNDSQLTMCVTALKAMGCWFVDLLTLDSSVKDVDIAQQIEAVYPQPSTTCKPKPTVNCKLYKLLIHVYTIQHRTVLIIFLLILQTIIIAQMLSTAEKTLRCSKRWRLPILVT